MPYVNAALLPKYVGRTVRLIGRLSQASPDGQRLQVEAADGGTVIISRLNVLFIRCCDYFV